MLSFEFADHIFLNSNNKLIPNSNYDSYLEKICNKAGIEKISMHTLRHTFAARCIESGMKPKTVQKLLEASWTRQHFYDNGFVCSCDRR